MIAEKNSLNVSQLQSLLTLEPNTPIAISQLSCTISCDASYATGIVDRLVAMNLITRQESSADRRIKTIQLTSEGIARRTECIRALDHLATISPIVNDMQPEYITQLQTMLDKIQHQTRTDSSRQ